MRANIRLPEGGQARPPLAVAIERPFGALKSTYAVEAGTLRVARWMRFDRQAGAAADRGAYESFRRAVYTDHEQKFSMTPLAASAATAESLHEEGRAALTEKAYPRAIELLMQAIDRDPGRADVWNELGRALRDSGDSAAALEAFSMQIEANPFDETAYAERAYLLMEKLGRADEAEPDLLKQIEVAPFKAWSYARMGARRRGQGRYAEAAAVLRAGGYGRAEDEGPLARPRLGAVPRKAGCRRAQHLRPCADARPRGLAEAQRGARSRPAGRPARRPEGSRRRSCPRSRSDWPR